MILELTGGRVATDHIDIFFLFFVELAVYQSIVFVQKRNTIFNILAGISLGAAVLSKWLPGLIVLPIWLLIVVDAGDFKPKEIISQFAILILTSVTVFLPWQIYIYHSFPLEANWEASYNLKHITEVLSDQSGPFYYFLNKIRINYGELIYLPLLWFLWKTLTIRTDKKLLAISTWFLIPFLFFSFAETKMQAYILFVSPALFIMTADFWLMMYAYRNQHKWKWIFNLILFLLIALPVRYSIERIKPFEKSDRNPKWVADLKNLNNRKIENGVLFNYDKPIEAMFYTNMVVYIHLPDKKTIDELQQKGYKILISDNGEIPAYIKSIKGISFIKISATE